MGKGRSGMMMEIYILGDSRMATELKERCTSCNKMALTNFRMNEIEKELISQGHKFV
jgi:hypothetical protein